MPQITISAMATEPLEDRILQRSLHIYFLREDATTATAMTHLLQAANAGLAAD